MVATQYAKPFTIAMCVKSAAPIRKKYNRLLYRGMLFLGAFAPAFYP